MNTETRYRPLTLALLIAAGILVPLPVSAQSPTPLPTRVPTPLPTATPPTTPTVIIRAYDSKGVDTGKCLSNPFTYTGNYVNGSVGTSSYILAACNQSSPAQRFTFNPNGYGGPLVQNIAVVGSDGAPFCAMVLGAKTTGWKVNTVVTEAQCSTPGAGGLWRWTGGQIIATESPAPYSCLTANSSLGPSIRIGNCAMPATLTRWDMLIVK